MKKVKVYCDPFCPSCKDVADFLKMKGVSFDFINVEEDEKARKKAISISGQEKLPIIVVGKEVIVAPNNKDELKAKLEEVFG